MIYSYIVILTLIFKAFSPQIIFMSEDYGLVLYFSLLLNLNYTLVPFPSILACQLMIALLAFEIFVNIT